MTFSALVILASPLEDGKEVEHNTCCTTSKYIILKLFFKYHNNIIGLPSSFKVPFPARYSQPQWIPWCPNHTHVEISSFSFISIHPLALTVVSPGSGRWDKGFLNSCCQMATTQQEAYVVPYYTRLYQWQPQFNFVYHV